MALLVDGSCPALAELERYEGAIASVANTEGIEIGDKMVVAREEITTELGRFLKDQGSFASGAGGAGQVVLTEPLRRWLVLHSIASVYREARFGQVSDRYAGKWKEYTQLAYQAKRDLLSSGIGIVWNAISRPGRPQTSTISGSLPAGTYFIRTSWAGPDGIETESSEPVAHTLAAAGGIQISAGAAPATATGWNVYAGQFEAEVALQNVAPLVIGSAFDLAGGSLTAGRGPSSGQLPDVLVRVFNGLLRG